MSRYSNKRSDSVSSGSVPLPVVDWSAIGRSAPVHLEVDYQGPKAPLPEADVFIVTWTTAEWSAFDHVFYDSQTERYSDNREFEKKWLAYQLNAPDGGGYPLWGEYQMVGIDNAKGEQLKVLLFHSEAHLAYSPYLPGLTTMLNQIIAEVNPQRFISIGTAGGCNDVSYLGDTVVTNAGYVDLSLPENNAPYNHETVVGEWFPESNLYDQVKSRLLFKLDQVCTFPALESMVKDMHSEYPFTQPYGLSDLLNKFIAPEELGNPNIQLRAEVPLKTTDSYYIALSETSDDQYAVLEMDDAIIAKLCKDAGIAFAFYRNISDPVVRVFDEQGGAIPQDVRDKWSSEIYSSFGFYTSYNGALACYAGVAAFTITPRA